MMENRSFDHFLGWLPTADGMQAGLNYLDRRGATASTYHLGGDFTGCGHSNPIILIKAGGSNTTRERSDGFLCSGSDAYSLGYYREEDLTFFGALARRYTTLDRYFCSFLGPTFPSHLSALSADRQDQQHTKHMPTGDGLGPPLRGGGERPLLLSMVTTLGF